MRLRRSKRSTNIEDRRGRGGGFGGFGRTPSGPRRGLKLGGVGTIIVLIIGFLLGGNPFELLNSISGGGGGGVYGPATSGAPAPSGVPAGDEQADFAAAVLGDTEETWTRLFAEHGERYREPTLVLFSGAVRSACGMGSAASGPFYCPGDSKLYLDMSFFRQLQQLGAPGDFARAYVIAHEVGHHIQNLTGVERQVRGWQRQVGKTQQNQLSVLMELQADCYAGVWAHHANANRQILEQGDVEEGLNAAAAIGDDRLQQMSGRGVHPESFTHGSSEQRVRWFKTGLQSGSVAACDTFEQAGLRG